MHLGRIFLPKLLPSGWLIGALLLAVTGPWMKAQSLEDLNIQIHGYATQGFLYTTQNNMLTTHSSDGSPAWTEAVVNVTAQPNSKLRVGVQARYFVLGNYGNSITLDWAAADYKVNDRFGVRFGKVKTPSGLFNEIQDIDPSYMWSLLPQGIYPISSRNSQLAHYGGVVYGTLKAGQAGKFDYRGWGGERIIAADDGYTLASRESGFNQPNGIAFTVAGATLNWHTPLKGLLVGATEAYAHQSETPVTAGSGALSGTQEVRSRFQPDYFGRFERDKYTIAGEYTRTTAYGTIALTGLPAIGVAYDTRAWYGMANYRATGKLTGGLYYSQWFDVQSALGPSRYSKDWAISGRYDFNEFLYMKAEQHFIDGTGVGYDTQLNPNGLKPDTRLTVLKIGVSF
jgi:hypothetical protein